MLDGIKHSLPSPQTLERFGKLEHFMQDLTHAIKDLEAHSKERAEKIDAMMNRVDEMYKIYNNGTFLISIAKWGFGTVLALGGGYLMFKQIINGQN